MKITLRYIIENSIPVDIYYNMMGHNLCIKNAVLYFKPRYTKGYDYIKAVEGNTITKVYFCEIKKIVILEKNIRTVI